MVYRTKDAWAGGENRVSCPLARPDDPGAREGNEAVAPDSSRSSPDPKTFELALTMAGAVSAGAYTAGVLDFLVLALGEHEKLRGQEGQPRHRVVIKAMSGASAGGVAAGLGISPLAAGPAAPARPFDATAEPGRVLSSVLPDLFDLWVVRLSLLDGTGRGGLLGTADLDSGQPVLSLLDSSHLDRTAEAVLAHATWSGNPLPFLARDLDLFLTTTNLRGVPFTVAFDGDRAHAGHAMSWHADWRHFRVSGLGTADLPRPWLEAAGDCGIHLDLETLPAGGPLPFAGDPAWRALRDASIATGAFPVGLAAREIAAHTDDYGSLDQDGAFRGRAWPVRPGRNGRPPRPAWKPNRAGMERYKLPYTAVDGGACNNEPFELAHYALLTAGEDGTLRSNPRDPREADRAVIMIDPFPEAPPFDPDLVPRIADRMLAGVVTALFAALKNQARFKLDELVAALDERIFSRFLIAPVRTVDKERGPEPVVLATGGLGGFLGFFDRRFREHDYQLGRRNCQKFLKDRFCLAAANPLFDGWEEAAREPWLQRDEDVRDTDGKPLPLLPVIPLVGAAAREERLLAWPRMGPGDIDAVMAGIGHRLEALVPRLIREHAGTARWRLVLAGGWKLGRGAVLAFLRRQIEAELIARDQHQAWAGLEGQERLVVSALVAPRHDLRTVRGLLRENPGLTREAVERKLAGLDGRLWHGPAHASGEPTFTLADYRPNVLYRIPLLRRLAHRASRLSVDLDEGREPGAAAPGTALL